MRRKPGRPKKEVSEPKPNMKPKQPEGKYDFMTSSFSAIKDFVDYGLNRTLIDIKTRRMVDVETREDHMKEKKEKDLVKIVTVVLITVIVGAVAFTVITQVMNYNEATEGHRLCEISLGRCEGQLERISAGGSTNTNTNTQIQG